MGVVYEGLDPLLNRQVAVKTILRSALGDPDTIADSSVRFVREAQAIARLSHPNIVAVFDFGEEGDVAYFVMEFVRGRELKSYFDESENFSLEESLRIVGELLAALEFAHQQGVVHRDVKPANVMLDAERRVKLTDFGVARLADASGERTMAGTMVGTPSYMSPEQIQGLAVGSRTDLFAVGIILYQCLTGTKPFPGPGAWTVQKQIVHDDPAPPSVVNPEIDPGFDAIIARALAKEPADRYASAAEFAADLRRMLASLPAAGAGRRLPPVAPTPAVASQRDRAEASASVSEPTFVEPTGASPAVAPPPPAAPVREPISAPAAAPVPPPAAAPVSPPAVAPGGGRAWAWGGGVALIVAVVAYLAWPGKAPAPAPAPPEAAGGNPPAAPGNNGVSGKAVETARGGTTPAAKAPAEPPPAATGRGDRTPTENGLAEKASAEKVSAEKGGTEKGGTEKVPAEKVSAEKAAVEKGLAEKTPVGKSGAATVPGQKPAVDKPVAEQPRPAETSPTASPPPVPARSEGPGAKAPSAPAPRPEKPAAALVPRPEAPAKTRPAAGKSPGSARCDDLLQRFQLGEGLSPDDLMVLQKECRK